MTRTRLVQVAVAAVLSGLTGYWAIDSRGPAEADLTRAPPPPERSAPRPPARLNANERALIDLETKVDALRGQVDEMARTQEQLDEPAEPTSPPPSAADTEQDTSAQAIADKLDEHFAREARDSAFTQEAQARISEFLARPELLGTSARKVECGTSMCRVEMHHDATQSREAFIDAMSDVLPPDSQGFSHLDDLRDLDTELYFSRTGYTLPIGADPSG